MRKREHKRANVRVSAGRQRQCRGCAGALRARRHAPARVLERKSNGAPQERNETRGRRGTLLNATEMAGERRRTTGSGYYWEERRTQRCRADGFCARPRSHKRIAAQQSFSVCRHNLLNFTNFHLIHITLRIGHDTVSQYQLTLHIALFSSHYTSLSCVQSVNVCIASIV